MDDKQIAKFRALLLQHKQSLQETSETNESAAETVELDQTRVGRLSRMDALQGQAMSIAANALWVAVKRVTQGRLPRQGVTAL